MLLPLRTLRAQPEREGPDMNYKCGLLAEDGERQQSRGRNSLHYRGADEAAGHESDLV